jgi:hypothetical protein
MKQPVLILTLLITITACGQPSQAVVKQLKDNISRTSLRKIYFFETELISVCEDTSIRKAVVKKINEQYKKLQREDLPSQKERTIFLTLLRKRIAETNTTTTSQNKIKMLLVQRLSGSNIDFKVDIRLMEERLDPEKRGMPFGDEECDEDFSKLIFFLYDPQLYVQAMKHSKIINPSGELTFPSTCTLEELTSLPIFMKKRVQSELLKLLDQYSGPDYDQLRKILKKADLNASYN